MLVAENNQAKPNGVAEEVGYASGGCQVSWLGKHADNYLEWRAVYCPVAGSYRLTFVYFSQETRSMKYSVNGETAKNLSNLRSSNWQTPATREVTVHLNAGVNTVRLSNTSAWMPNMDYMKVELLEADGIQDVGQAPTAQVTDDAIYDLVGRRLANESQSHGVYIVNGKKIAK